MSRISEVFQKVAKEKRAAFMPYICAGDPDLKTTRKLIEAMAQAGADLVEVGIPFSDPIADGPTIQLANQRALAAGTTVDGILKMIAELRKTCQVPVMLMGSYNPIYVRGVENFCREAAAAGVDGLIIPDLLPDEADELIVPARKAKIDTVFLIAPTSTAARLKLAEQKSTGFVYAVSLTGVTGERDRLPDDLTAFIKSARRYISKPLAVGFGIGTPEHAKAVARIADGVIVGSAMVKRIAEAVARKQDPCKAAAAFARSLSQAVRGKVG